MSEACMRLNPEIDKAARAKMNPPTRGRASKNLRLIAKMAAVAELAEIGDASFANRDWAILPCCAAIGLPHLDAK